MTITMTKSYSELVRIDSFEERFRYLALDGSVGMVTFGGHRYLNQVLYHTAEWKGLRSRVVVRDNGLDLAHPDYPISGNVYVHHINPITVRDILERNPCVFDLENLISVSFDTHNAIHYGDIRQVPRVFIERKKNDTCPWR